MKNHRLRHRKTYHSEQAISDATRELERLSATNDQPKRGHHIIQKRYTIFDTICLDFGATFINYAMVRKRAARCSGIPPEEAPGSKVQCEECGAYMFSAHKNRHFEAFHSEHSIAKATKEFEKLSSIAVYPLPRETWGKIFRLLAM